MRMLLCPLHKGSSKMTLYIGYIRFSLFIYISVIRIFLKIQSAFNALCSQDTVLKVNIYLQGLESD